MISKHKFIRNIFVVYISVLIPVLIVSLLITCISFSLTEAREKEQMQSVLQEITGELDDRYIEFLNQSNALSEMLELLPSAALQNPENARQAILRLRSANLFNGRTNDIFVYYGVGKLYSSNGLVNKRSYFKDTLNCTGDSVNRAEAVLDSPVAEVLLLRVRSGNDLLMYHFPMARKYSGYCISAQFILSSKYMENMLESYITGKELRVRLLPGEDGLCFQINEGKCSILEEEAFRLLQKEGDIVLQETGIAGNMKVELHFDPKVSWERLWDLQTLNLCLLFLGVTVSVLVSFLFSYYRWGKFYSLTSAYTIAAKPSGLKRTLYTEYDCLRVILEQSSLENEQVKQDTRQYRRDMICQIAQTIFHGLVTDETTIRNLLSMCALEFTEEYYFLCGIVMDKTEELHRLQDVLSGNTLYCIGLVNEKPILLLLLETSFSDKDCTERKKRAEPFLTAAKAADISCSRCVFSQVYDTISLVNYAYLEVCGLAENHLKSDQFMECWDTYIDFSDEKGKERQAEQIKEFLDILETRDYERIKSSLQAMLNGLEKGEKIWNYYVCYCIRQAVLLTVRNEKTDENTALIADVVQIDPMQEMHFAEKILKVIKRLCETEKYARWIEQAIAYMQAHYHRYDLSLEEVAGAVGMNKTQLSRLFKTQVGQGYLEYLTRLRMERAKVMLEESDLPVKVIIQAVGYIDKTNFIRKFRSYYGMLPGEYRSRFGKAVENEETHN